MILIQKMHASGILRFDDSVNDMNFWSKFKYTSKGPNSLGGNNSNNIGIRYRGLHPSFLGEIDVLVCGNSDPGTSGLLSPFAKINGLYFNDDEEPHDFYYQLMKDLEEKYEKDDKITYIKCDFETEKDCYNALMDMQKYADENISICGTSREGHYELVINEGTNMDDLSKPTNTLLARKKKTKHIKDNDKTKEVSEDANDESPKDEK